VAVLLLGWLFKRGLVDPLFKHGMMPIVVATIGLSIAMRNGVRAGYSSEPQPFPQVFPEVVLNVAGVNVSGSDIGTFVFALCLVLLTQTFLNRTVTGRAMQAVAQNTESAAVLGINVPRMIFYTFAINAVLAAAAALLSRPPIWPNSTWARAWAPKHSLPPSLEASTTRVAHCSAACWWG
jgi:branched-chain amino acid transport system permease protein